jgi:hypothetical protein
MIMNAAGDNQIPTRSVSVGVPILVALIGAAAALGAAVLGNAGGLTNILPGSPTQTVTATATVTAAAPATAVTPVSAVYWQGAVGITFPGGINFDLKPATTSADGPTNILFGSNSLEAPYTGTTILVSQWTGAGRPTQTDCANWVLTHPTNVVNNVAEGMQICIRTVQGRIGQLTVTSISPDRNTLNVMAVIWT